MFGWLTTMPTRGIQSPSSCTHSSRGQSSCQSRCNERASSSQNGSSFVAPAGSASWQCSGVAWLLPRLVGPMNAADLLLSGRKIGAEEAQAMGLVRALPDNGFLETVQARAAEMSASCSPRSMAVLKRQLWLGQRQTLAQACQQADDEMALAARCNDFCEGVAALIEKRQPVFGGL